MAQPYRHGHLTATGSATGERQVETAELIRVYGELSGTDTTMATVAERQEPTGSATAMEAELVRLRNQVAKLEARLADKQQHIDHRHTRYAWLATMASMREH